MFAANVPAPARPAEPRDAKFAACFAPLRSARAALSPDGRRVAYTVRSGDATWLLIAATDNPTAPLAKALIGRDADATPSLGTKESFALAVGTLVWAANDRLVLATNAIRDPKQKFLGNPTGGEILSIDADGKNARTIFLAEDAWRLTAFSTDLPTGERGLGRPPPPAHRTSAGDGLVHLPTPDQSAAERHPERQPDYPPDPVDIVSPDLAAQADRSGALSVFETATGERDVVLVKAGQGARYGIFHVNFRTGKIVRHEIHEIDYAFVPLVDRQGRPRVGIPWSRKTDYPWAPRFDFAEKGAAAKRDLADLFPADERAGLALTAANFFGDRTLVLGFDYDPAVLLYATNVRTGVYELRGLDTRTGRRTDLDLSVPGVDLAARAGNGFGDPWNLVFDRHERRLVGARYGDLRRKAVWADPQLQEVQDELEDAFRGQSVDLQEWDAARRQFLVRAGSPVDAGAFHLYDRGQRQLREFMQRQPKRTVARPPTVIELNVPRADGTALRGLLVFPRSSRVRPVPVLVHCSDAPMAALSEWYDPEIEAFAEMGVAVLQVNTRGTDGFGVKHLRSVEGQHEAAQIEDLLAVLEEAAKIYAINPRRVAVTGRGWGGFVALRAALLHPGRFRAVWARDPWMDLRDEVNPRSWDHEAVGIDAGRRRWFFGDEARMQAVAFLEGEQHFGCPVRIEGDPGVRPKTNSTSDRYRAARRLAERERSAGAPVEFVDLEVEARLGLPGAHARLFARAEEFFNLSLYDFGVELGPMSEIPESEVTR